MVYLIVSFLLAAFAQPAWIPTFGVLTAAFGYALFWRAMLNFSRPRDRFLLSLAWFSAVQGVQLSWMMTTDYMGPLILVVYLMLILGMGAQFGILSFFFTSPLRWDRALAIAGCWTLFEWLRLFFICGFTFNPVGLALAASPYSLQFASIWGVFGLSFWVILVNGVALKAFLEKSRANAVAWASMALFPYLFGVAQQTWVEKTPSSRTVRVALVQTALFPEQKDFIPEKPTAYIHPIDQWERILSVLQLDRPIDLLVLPEAALPLGAHRVKYFLDDVRPLWEKYLGQESLSLLSPLGSRHAILDRGVWKVNNAFLMQALAKHLKTHIITGLDDSDTTGKYNAAFHFQPEDVPPQRYEKRILAPIAEYIPFPKWGRFSKFVADQFGIYSSFDAGTKTKIFNTPLPVGISICLEETFSSLSRELRLGGAQLFVTLANDIWFPRSKLPEQHFHHGRIRAAENGVYIVRACNTGITGGVDCFGRPLAQLPVSEKTPSSLYLSIPVRSFPTLYTWWGDSAILGISISSLVLVALKKLLG